MSPHRQVTEGVSTPKLFGLVKLDSGAVTSLARLVWAGVKAAIKLGMLVKTSGARPSRRGGLGLLTNKLFVVPTRSDLDPAQVQRVLRTVEGNQPPQPAALYIMSCLHDIRQHAVLGTLPNSGFKSVISIDYFCFMYGPNDCHGYEAMQILPF